MTVVVPWWSFIPLVLAAYMVGSIPFGVLVGRMRGVDPRTVGSGNIGATNVMRALGPGWAVGVLLLDLAKGFLPVMASHMWLIGLFKSFGVWGKPAFDPIDGAMPLPTNYVHLTDRGMSFETGLVVAAVVVLVGVAAMVGHNWSIFLKGKGGKGASTGFGVVLALDWRVALLIAIVFVLVVAVTRYVSLGSTLGAWCVPLGLWYWHRGTLELPPLLAFGLAAALLISFKHRSNYKRLLNGTESELGRKPPTEVSG